MSNWMSGSWMQTYTGRRFYPLSPPVESVDPLDIAHALSLICRYGGHVQRFYSVAEHCVLMSDAVSPRNASWALLHDATEAYMGDMITPIKREMSAYRAAESQLHRVICERFGLDLKCPVEVKDADTRIMRDECAELMSPSPLAGVVSDVAPLGVTIYGWEPKIAEQAYLQQFINLFGEV